MNEEYNLVNLKEQFTLKHLKKLYQAQKDEVLGTKIVVKVLSKKEPVIVQKKTYSLFTLSDDVTSIPALLLNTDESAEQRKILEESLRRQEPLILENPKKLHSTLKTRYVIEISSKILPIGTIIEPLSSYGKKEINYFFEIEKERKTKQPKLKEAGSPFVTASDLLKAEPVEEIRAADLNVNFSVAEEIAEYFRNNSKKWTIHFDLQGKKLQTIQTEKISYIIEYVDKNAQDYSSKIEFIALDEKNSVIVKILDITILEKEFYLTIKKNIDFLCSIKTLQALVKIEV